MNLGDRMTIALVRSALISALCVGGAAACPAPDRPAGAPRIVRTTLPASAEGVGVGTDVVMAGLSVGSVVAADSADGGVRLILEIRHPAVPLRAGLRAEVRPAGIFVADVLALVPGPEDAPLLPEGADIPGTPRAATAAERRAAMRVVLPAVGLPALGALANDPPPLDGAGRAPHR
jgi:ABC-type transporter Mla subunit MlaD